MLMLDRKNVERILAWNLNHRAGEHRIPPWIVSSIEGMSPDIVVLTEYVEGRDHGAFLDALSRAGLASVLLTRKLRGENQVLIAAREQLNPGELQPPPIHASVPQNMLHVVTAGGLNVLGFRMPTSKEFDARFKRPTWEWLLEAAAHLDTEPAIIVGDFNTAPGDPRSGCGDCLDRLSQTGWRHIRPDSGYSFRHRSGRERQIDHGFVSPCVIARCAEYRWDFHTAAHDAPSGNTGIPDHAMLIVDLEAGDRLREMPDR